MISEKDIIQMVETVMRAAGQEVSGIAELVGQPARVFTYPNGVKVCAFFAVDLTFRDDGTIIIQESNGSNGASTGMLWDGQTRRASTSTS